MKTFKINKSDYTNFDKMLKRVGAVDKNETQGYPSYVYWNESDLTKAKKALLATAKKEGYTKKGAEMAAGIYIPNLGPNTLKTIPLKPGFMLVDDRAINEEMEANDEPTV